MWIKSKKLKVSSTLEIYIDIQLSYNAQIKHLKSKLSQLCGVSFRLSKFLNFQAAKNMYNSCIYSVISYCIGVWGGVTQITSRCNILNIIHWKIVKNLFSNWKGKAKRKSKFMQANYKVNTDSHRKFLYKTFYTMKQL